MKLAMSSLTNCCICHPNTDTVPERKPKSANTHEGNLAAINKAPRQNIFLIYDTPAWAGKVLEQRQIHRIDNDIVLPWTREKSVHAAAHQFAALEIKIVTGRDNGPTGFLRV